MASRTQIAEKLINDLAETLQIPTERYEAAERSYKSLGAWLERPASRFTDVHVNVYVQGSFRLGTAIRPINGDEDYDLDVVCEFTIAKTATTQAVLFANLGYEIKAYAVRYDMQEPSPWTRCWTLDYADSAQFHMDILPSVPDGELQRSIRERQYVELAFVEDSISICDSNHHNYRLQSEDWPVSNPNGYADWFFSRMYTVLNKRRTAMMLAEAKADISEIPVFRARTPLQSAVQILKRHRDIQFSEDATGKPSSIIITTLAAHSYLEEASVTDALINVLARMDEFIEIRGEEYWIANPSDPRENFADNWQEEPDKKDGFFDWLETARTDFRTAAEQFDAAGFVETLAPRMGRRLVEAAASRRVTSALETASSSSRYATIRRILDAPHRKPMIWPLAQSGYVHIIATAQRQGFRPREFPSDDTELTKGTSLRFEASTNIPRPFKVYWQVVNTGVEARNRRGLRGTIVESGNLTKLEGTSYRGSHSVECFIVKDSFCVAHSGLFIVKIA